MWVFIYNYWKCIMFRKNKIVKCIWNLFKEVLYQGSRVPSGAWTFWCTSHYLKCWELSCGSGCCISRASENVPFSPSHHNCVRGSCLHCPLGLSLPTAPIPTLPPPKKCISLLGEWEVGEFRVWPRGEHCAYKHGIVKEFSGNSLFFKADGITWESTDIPAVGQKNPGKH